MGPVRLRTELPRNTSDMAPRLIVDNEAARLNALRDLNLLDTPPSESFDRLTRMASRLLGAPVSTISLTDGDRQWFKSRVGVDMHEIPREQAPCAYAIRNDEIFVVPDLLADERFVTSPLAQAGIRFYAGAPLLTRSGFGLGTICVVDVVPREVGEDERTVLRDLAGMVMAQIEVQNMIGRVDATSGQPNEHMLFEDLDELAATAPGEARVGLLVDLVTAEQASQGLRVLGAGFGEDTVRGAVARIRLAMGNAARLYQVGPSRFLVMWDDAQGRDADAMAAALDAALRGPILCRDIPVLLDPAMGLHRFVLGRAAPRDVLRCLFNAAEDARKSASRRATYCAAEDQAHSRRFSLLHEVPSALAGEGQFSLAYQPRVDMASGRCAGAEALIRWKHPTLGGVAPDQFIPAVERTAMVRDLTDWVLEAAIAQVARWHDMALPPRVSINASVLNLDEPDFVERLAAKLDRHAVKPSAIELEFTESALARDGDTMIRRLAEFRALGVEVAIDDFGTGYSSLSYLQRLPVDILKIDRSFNMRLAADERDRKLVRTMIAMAHDLGFRVVAEGIEDRDSYDLLASWGCDEGQGYHIARPMPPHDLERWLAARGAADLTLEVAAA